jgi:hypothetical protein
MRQPGPWNKDVCGLLCVSFKVIYPHIYTYKPSRKYQYKRISEKANNQCGAGTRLTGIEGGNARTLEFEKR